LAPSIFRFAGLLLPAAISLTCLLPYVSETKTKSEPLTTLQKVDDRKSEI
jgi:hypothetical protein